MIRSARRLDAMTLAVAVLTALLVLMAAGCTQSVSDAPGDIEAPPPDDAAITPTADGQPDGDEADGEEPAADADETQADGADQPADGTEDAEEDGTVTQTADGDATEAKTLIKIKTNKGEMVGQLFDEKMPITAGSFLLLVEDDFYDGLTFHRVVPEFVIQGGDPNGDGSGGPGFSIPLESPGKVHHERGILSMARAQPLDSAGSQFFVCLSNNQNVQSLDELMGGYAAFGKVVEGMDVADSIRVGDRISEVEVLSESEHADAARDAAKKARIQ